MKASEHHRGRCSVRAQGLSVSPLQPCPRATRQLQLRGTEPSCTPSPSWSRVHGYAGGPTEECHAVLRASGATALWEDLYASGLPALRFLLRAPNLLLSPGRVRPHAPRFGVGGTSCSAQDLVQGGLLPSCHPTHVLSPISPSICGMKCCCYHGLRDWREGTKKARWGGREARRKQRQHCYLFQKTADTYSRQND